MNRKISWLLCLVFAFALLAGCGKTASPEPSEEPLAVADASQMTTVEDVVQPGMVPVPATDLVDGEYPIAVDCSSSMFRIASCLLRVADGKMEADLTLNSDSYAWVYPGTAEDAARAPEADYVQPVSDGGEGKVFTIPVEALDAGVLCAAYSVKKELWYDRTLCFRADSLPLEAFQPGVIVTPESLGLADGAYTVDVSLAGGSGKASVTSPARLTVENGLCTAEIEWSSPNYDYMLVNGEKLLPVNDE
ncbi:MAG: hypothetical protein ACSW8E_05505, partial [Clostridia bacterium]